MLMMKSKADKEMGPGFATLVKKFVSLILIACLVSLSVPCVTARAGAYSLDEIDISELDLGRLEEFGFSRDDVEEFWHRRPPRRSRGHRPPPPPRSRRRHRSRIDNLAEGAFWVLLGVLLNEAIENRDRDTGKSENKDKGEPKIESQSKREDKIKSEAKAKASLSDKEKYDELVKVCKSGSLRDFELKFEEYDLTGDAVISYTNNSQGDIFRDEHSAALISIAAEYSSNAQLVKFLLDDGADANADNGQPLRAAAKNARAETVKLLLYSGADIAKTDDRGRTALSFAASNDFDVNNRLAVIKSLRVAGADFNLRDRGGMSPWAYAVQSGAPEVVNYFLDNGADARLSNIYNLAKNNPRLANTQALKRIENINKRVRRRK